MTIKSYTILYLVILLFYLIRPALPFIEYIVKKEYIEKHLCVEKNNPVNDCHGKCYLHDQLTKQSEETEKNDKDKMPPSRSLDDQLQVPCILLQHYSFSVILSSFYQISPEVSFGPEIFIPPRG